MTPERLEEIKALTDAATPGPWKAVFGGDELEDNFLIDEDALVIGMSTWLEDPGNYWTAHLIEYQDCLDGREDDPEAFANAAFIAASRTIVPELIAEIERLRALVTPRPIETALKEWRDGRLMVFMGDEGYASGQLDADGTPSIYGDYETGDICLCVPIPLPEVPNV